MGLNTLSLAHAFLAEQVRCGDFCIDATAGRGGDTLFLCGLAGESGRVLAFDIQEEAVAATKALLREHGCNAEVLLESHASMGNYAAEGTVDAIVFNFGWLPGASHKIFTRAESSIAAIAAGLRLLRTGGVMSLCIYYGGENGFEERDALLEYLKTLDDKAFTVRVEQFWNRPNNPPIAVFLHKE